MAERILVVEDDRYFLGILRDYLSYVGFEVHTAEDGLSGWKLFQEIHPEAVLSDVLLPGLNGLELAARIKSSERGGETAVLMMSAVYKNEATIRRDLRQCGANDYLVKPFSMPELRRSLTTHCTFDTGGGTASQRGNGGPELAVLQVATGSPLPSQGEIESDFLAPLLLELRATGHTGVLSLRDGKRWKDIIWLNGHPVWADGGDGHDRLGTMLLEEGTITKEQFAATVELMRTSEVDFGSALTDGGVLSPTELYTQLRRLVLRRVVAAFAWNIGTWELSSEFPKQTSSFEVQPLGAIWQGICTHGELGPMKELLGAYRQRYVIPTSRFHTDFAELKKQDNVGFVGTFLSGRRTMEDLEDMEILEPEELLRALWMLYKAGMVGFGVHPTDEDEDDDHLSPPTLDLPEVPGSVTGIAETIIQDYLRLWQADFYTIFGIEPGTSEEEILAALSRNPLTWETTQLPPDLPYEIRNKAEALDHWVEEARETLQDRMLRDSYTSRFREGLTGIYRKVAEPEETEAAMFFEMGKAFVQARDFREAELSFARAVECAPTTAEYLAHQGWATYRKHEGSDSGVKGARELLGRALALDDHLPLAHYFSGIIHRDQRNYDAAMRSFRSALSFDSQFEAARTALRQTSELSGR